MTTITKKPRLLNISDILVLVLIGSRFEYGFIRPISFGTIYTFQMVEGFLPKHTSSQHFFRPITLAPFKKPSHKIEPNPWRIHSTNTKDYRSSNATFCFEDIVSLVSTSDYIDDGAKNRLIQSLKDQITEESSSPLNSRHISSSIEKQQRNEARRKTVHDRQKEAQITIPTLEGPWEDSGSRFHSSGAWQSTPLFMKGAFIDDLNDPNGENYPFPTWNDILELACTGGIVDWDYAEGESWPDGQYIGEDENDDEGDDNNYEIDSYYNIEEDYEEGEFYPWGDDEAEADSTPSRLIQYSWPRKEEMGSGYYQNKVNTDWLDTFEIDQFGPFDDAASLEKRLSAEAETSCAKDTNMARTLLVNDVDRWFPKLSDWMDRRFNNNNSSVLPARWRRDDAQISLSYPAGGIGPHVDDYDVFLIQLAGERSWDVLWEIESDDGEEFYGQVSKISVREETECILPNSSTNGVRILNVTQLQSLQYKRFGVKPKMTRLHLRPGDCLYLPPRVLHCGTALIESDQKEQRCMTLSVGCRAPSSMELLGGLSEMIRKAALLDSSETEEMLTFPSDAVLQGYHKRYTNIELDDHKSEDHVSLPQSSWLSPQVKGEMKALILHAVETALEDDENVLDPLIGKLVTRSNRLDEDESASVSSIGSSFSYPKKFGTLTDEQRRWPDSSSLLEECFGQVSIHGPESQTEIVLRRAEGIAFAWSSIHCNEREECKFRLYAQGRPPFEVFDAALTVKHENDTEYSPVGNPSVCDSNLGKLFHRICNGPPLTRKFLVEELGFLLDFSDMSKNSISWLLHQLVEEGLLYWTDPPRPQLDR